MNSIYIKGALASLIIAFALTSCYHYRLTGDEIRTKANENLPQKQDLTICDLEIKKIDTVILSYGGNSVKIKVSMTVSKDLYLTTPKIDGGVTFSGEPLVRNDTIFFSNIKVDSFNFLGDIFGAETAISNFVVDKYFSRVPLYELKGIEKWLLKDVYVNDDDKLVIKIGLF